MEKKTEINENEIRELLKDRSTWTKAALFVGGAITGGYLVYQLMKREIKDQEHGTGTGSSTASLLGQEAILLLSALIRNRLEKTGTTHEDDTELSD